MRITLPTAALLALIALPLAAQQQAPPRSGRAATTPPLSAGTFAGLELRPIGPAVMGGRIADVAIDPTRRSTWYVATGSGGVWKTESAGTTWRPIFERNGAYSIGVVALDPGDPRVVWVGTGENTSQRSVGFGNGVFRSSDGGESWEHMGLENTEHIGRIVFDPRSSDVVYVAAQGPLWSSGGERGLYKTTDGGRTWTRVLHVSENTGITDVALDPGNPDVVYAAAYQRRRHVGIQIAGGPEAGIFRSTDAGTTWRRLAGGLPEGVDLGRIGIALSPQNPDVVYAVIAAAGGSGGFFRSADRGETWVRQSDYVPTDPQYYMELYPDPNRFDRVYSLDVQLQVTDDGGKTFQQAVPGPVHVDYHAVVFDPADPDYLMVGNDGGLYQSWDARRTWSFVDNLPIAQFYRIDVDDARPFYNVYGGTQDNGSVMGPSRTATAHGILNRDWVAIGGGDGMQPRSAPNDPNTVYVQSQNGAMSRLDLRTGESVGIRPRPGDGDSLRWAWDVPLVVSPHAPDRLYFGANRLFRSDDRGDHWTPISPDLTRRIDRDTLPVMGRRWGEDAVGRHLFTAPLGTIFALDESALRAGLIYVGTDDGLIQVTEDAGGSWRGATRLPGVPQLASVADLQASRHDPDRVYAALQNYQRGDFRPYLLRSDDRGRSWRSIAGDLPERHVVWSVVEDHVNPELLFVGTESGLFFTVDGGARWIELTGGAPHIPFRDLAVQRRRSDLVAGTFGRGIYILDDYSPLRGVTPALLARDGVLFPVADALVHAQRRVVGGAQGHGLFAAPNPSYGATFTYYLRDGVAAAGPAPDRQEGPAVVVTITDPEGNTVREVEGPAAPGLHRVAWNLQLAAPDTANRRAPAPVAAPGRYTARLALRAGGTLTPLGEPQEFEVVPLFPGAARVSER